MVFRFHYHYQFRWARIPKNKQHGDRWPRYHQRKFQCRLSWLRFHLYWLQVLQFESWYPTVACGSCHVERNDCWWFRNLANHREFVKPCNTVNNGINYQPQLVGINYQPQLVSWTRISGCHQNIITWTWITEKGASRGEEDEKTRIEIQPYEAMIRELLLMEEILHHLTW